MCSMCHYCGAELAKSIEEKRKQDNGNAVISSAGDPIWSCKLCCERKRRDFVKQDGITPYATPMISPIFSLFCSDRSYSSCSDFSVDINSYDRGEDGQEVVSKNILPNGQLQHLSSEGPRKRVDSLNMMIESNLRDKKNSYDIEITEASNQQEAKESIVENSPTTLDKENGAFQSINVEMDGQIWEPPEPEYPVDDLEGTVAYDDDDDDDECGDGTEWGKPSSLSHIIDDDNGRYRFKEEKQRAMEEVINGKFKAIISQLLKSVGLNDSHSWVDIVISLSWEAALFLKPNAIDGKANGPDRYVKVKCIATGSRSQSQLIKGLVFKKHAAHKHMQTRYKNPRLLLIQGVLGQSSSGLSSFSSLDEEKCHLKCLSEMIDMCHPNVILVEKTVSRDVQECILEKGITLVFDMKLHRLERVALCTGLPVIPSDTLMNQKLKQNDSFKQCDSFHIEKFVEEHTCCGEGGKRASKTLMFLDGCPKHLGCTILLKGSHSEELKKIKCVVQNAVVMAYHLILETSFLIDQKAMFSRFLFTGTANVLLPGRESHSSEIGNLSVPCLDESTAETRSHEIDIPISNAFHEEDYHINGEINGDQIMNSGLDYNSALSLEPYNPAILSGLSSISASLKKVIGNNFPLASTAPYRSLSAYFGLNGMQSKLIEAVPTMKCFEVTDQFYVESKGDPDEEKPLEDRQPQSSHASFEAPLDLKVNGHDNEELKNKDINTMLNSQSILVLISSRNALRGTICKQSHFSHIMFYRNSDVPLGKFLQDNLLNQGSQCVVCGEPPKAHFYHYAHHSKQLTIQVKHLPKHLPGEAQGKLWMWSRCGKCKTGNGISKTTKRVLMSTAACSLSFGKFLELSFSEHSSSGQSSSCGHSLHKDFLYFFGSGPMVAMFSCSSVTTYTMSMPPKQLEFSKLITSDWLKEEFENVYMKGMLMFREVASFLVQIRSQFEGSTLNLKGSLKEFSDVEEMLKLEASEFEVNFQNAVAENGNANLGFHPLLNLTQLRWDLLLESCLWDRRLHSLLLPDPTVVVVGTNNKAVLEQLELYMSSADGEDNRTEAKSGNVDKCSYNTGNLKGETGSFVERNEFSGDKLSSNVPVKKSDKCDSIHNSTMVENIGKRTVKGACPVKSSSLEFVVTSKISALPHLGDENYQAEDEPLSDHLQVDRRIPISTDLSSDDSIVDSNGSSRGGSPRSLLSSLENLNGWFWMPLSEIRQIYMKDLLGGKAPKFESISSYTPEKIPTGNQVIREEGMRLHIPLGMNDYILSDYESELSSIIACALLSLKDLHAVAEISNEDGRDKLTESLRRHIQVPTITSPHWSPSGSSDSDCVSSLSISSDESQFSSFDGLNLMDSLVPPDTLNIEVPLGVSKSLGKGKYTVVCLYANQFRDLRERCCPSELDYIASLSRCRNWDAQGGKSKSFFAKTLDDRFIIKEIKKTEYDSFEKFALHYFKYMNQAFESGSQTCLAKVLGIYQVIVRQPKTGKESRHDLMVMENLTFGRNITRQYDLKGALHARFSSAADGSGDVLLDQNFVNDMDSSPLYLSNKDKRLLQRAIWNDTTFLNSINVMDYSLLVGVDTQRRDLVCGIIDYLRQYTWDKQLETWVKSSLVVPKNVLPTVISPKEYKKRFRKFMSTYFFSVPDDWCSEESCDPCEFGGGIRDDEIDMSSQSK